MTIQLVSSNIRSKLDVIVFFQKDPMDALWTEVNSTRKRLNSFKRLWNAENSTKSIVMSLDQQVQKIAAKVCGFITQWCYAEARFHSYVLMHQRKVSCLF